MEPFVNNRLSRRTALGLSSLALASCGKSEPYFGKSTPPARQTLIYEIASELSSLDDNAPHMRRLVESEERLQRAIPVLPLFFDSYSYLQKPYVRGLTPNVLDTPSFKDVWIDTSWRPQ